MAPRRKTRDSDCCSVNYLKSGLHIFNVIFLAAGLAVLAVGLWTILYKYEYVSLLTTVTYPLIAYVLVIAGGLVLVVGFLGCWAVCKEHRPLLICYTFSLLLIFLLEAMVGILAFVYAEQVQTELELNLNATFLENYSIDAEKTAAIDNMQQEFKCCGAVRFEDWEFSTWRRNGSISGSNLVPDSCCKTITKGCGLRDHPSNIYYSGCLGRLANFIVTHLKLLSAVGLGICVLQILGMIFSCYLYIKLKDIVDYV